MTVSTHRRVAIAGVFASGLLVAATACGASAAHSGSSGTTSGSANVSSATGTLHVVNNSTLGRIVEDGKGFTLYRFDADSGHPSASHCTGTCAIRWPAAPASDAKKVQGISHRLIGSVTRPGGGAKQLTIAGWPVYTYSQDSKPGQIGGQGVDGTWWAVTPTGGKASVHSGGATNPSSPSSPSSSGGGSGY